MYTGAGDLICTVMSPVSGPPSSSLSAQINTGSLSGINSSEFDHRHSYALVTPLFWIPAILNPSFLCPPRQKTRPGSAVAVLPYSSRIFKKSFFGSSNNFPPYRAGWSASVLP